MWYEDIQNLELLARYLQERDNMSLLEFADVLAKPWNWVDEYLEACHQRVLQSDRTKTATGLTLDEAVRAVCDE